MRLVDIGNIVKASDATGLLVITQLRPINVMFTLPQQQLPQINKSFTQGPLTVEALAGDSKSGVGPRRVARCRQPDRSGDRYDQTEGWSSRMRTCNCGPGNSSTCGCSVDTLKDVVVVPTAAVQRGPNGTFVYVVRGNDTVAMRPVTISLQDENLTVIPTGVQTGERIVTYELQPVWPTAAK